MTRTARKVLDDCHTALLLLDAEPDPGRWRVLWAGAVALIRAVGHVLHKVDGSDPLLKIVANESFGRWKAHEEHRIFREFIDLERNNLLKEYRSDVCPLDSVPIAIQGTINDNASAVAPIFMNLDENLFKPMVDGPWAGVDSRELYAEAIAWWERELQTIDDGVRRRRRKN